MQELNQELINTLRFDDKGLIPAIAQDWLDGAILMMAWMNRESIQLTISSGEVHYWSRSRQELWHKGATSGNFQKIKAIRYDCDSDVILLTIEQIGEIACHKGVRSCFLNEALNKSDARIDDISALLELKHTKAQKFKKETGLHWVL